MQIKFAKKCHEKISVAFEACLAARATCEKDRLYVGLPDLGNKQGKASELRSDVCNAARQSEK